MALRAFCQCTWPSNSRYEAAKSRNVRAFETNHIHEKKHRLLQYSGTALLWTPLGQVEAS